jgi:hypothetical protein
VVLLEAGAPEDGDTGAQEVEAPETADELHRDSGNASGLVETAPGALQEGLFFPIGWGLAPLGPGSRGDLDLGLGKIFRFLAHGFLK